MIYINAERLKEYLEFVIREEEKIELQKKFDELFDSINNLSREPQNEGHQNAFSEKYAALRSGVQKFESHLSPAQASFVTEIGGDKFFFNPNS